MYNINSHINVKLFSKKLPGEAGNVPLVSYYFHDFIVLNYLQSWLDVWKQHQNYFNDFEKKYKISTCKM